MVTDKPKPDIPLVAAREMLARHLDHEPRLQWSRTPGPGPDGCGHGDAADYETAVADWHEQQVTEQVLHEDHDGDASS